MLMAVQQLPVKFPCAAISHYRSQVFLIKIVNTPLMRLNLSNLRFGQPLVDTVFSQAYDHLFYMWVEFPW